MKLCECGCGRPAPLAEATHRRRGYVKGQPRRFIKGHHIRVQGVSQETRDLIASKLRGRQVSPEVGRKISEAKRGRPSRFTEEYLAVLAQRARAMTGERHPNWKGGDVSYKTLHQWVARHRPRTHVCDDCGATGVKTDWANISGEYHRELSDFRELCRPCHAKEHAQCK